MKFFLICLISIATIHARVSLAAPAVRSLTVEDFAYAIEIETAPPGPVYQVNLSDDVYGVAKKDFRDIRVFNASGEVVPFTLQYQTYEDRQSSMSRPVVLFPIQGAPEEAGAQNVVQVAEDAHGKVVQVRFSGQREGTRREVSAYLLDLRTEEQILTSLQIQWSPADRNRVLAVTVEASDDLKSWRTVSSGAVLAKLAFQGETLEQKKIELPGVRSKYLKITAEGGISFGLESVSGEFVSQQRLDSVKRPVKIPGRIRLPEEGAAGGRTMSENEFVYDANSVAPMDSVKVLLPEPNMFIRFHLASSGSENGPWVDRTSGTAYQLTLDGKELASAAIPLNQPIPDRYWLLKVEGKGINLRDRILQLELGYVPHQLLFLVRGSAPFRLVYGSAIAEGLDFGFGALLESLRVARSGQAVVPQASQLVGERKELGGPARLKAPPEEKPVPWKQFGLWGVLGLFVLLSAGMAWRLFRDLSAKSS